MMKLLLSSNTVVSQRIKTRRVSGKDEKKKKKKKGGKKTLTNIRERLGL